MSASKIAIQVLHVAQGMGTLVKIYTAGTMGGHKLTHLVLVDLGSDTSTRLYATDGVDKVIEALKEMANPVTGTGTPSLAFVVISHQDKDHWSLLVPLATAIHKNKLTVKVGALYYGGVKWADKATKNIKLFAKIHGAATVPITKSDYNTSGINTGVFQKIEDVEFRVLAVNVPSRRSSPDLKRNTSSAVVVVRFAGKRVVLPGDATSETLGYINNVLYAIKKKGGVSPVNPCPVLSAPHHGALRTLATNLTTKNPKLDIAQAFVEFCQPVCTAASAGFKTKHKHPSQQVMQTLTKYATTTERKHSFIVYDFGKKKWWSSGDTTFGAFTTIVATTEPIQRQTWTWVITATGETSFYSTVNGPAPATPRGPAIARPAADPPFQE
jgi:beta-lactamase superfamily II metal-dependent hydrolase